MNKIFIKLKKKFLLPTKYKFLRKKYIDELNVRPRATLWDRLQKEKEKLIKAEQKSKTNQIIQHKAIIEILIWTINDSTKR